MLHIGLTPPISLAGVAPGSIIIISTDPRPLLRSMFLARPVNCPRVVAHHRLSSLHSNVPVRVTIFSCKEQYYDFIYQKDARGR